MIKLLLFMACLPQLLWAQVDFNYVSPLKGANYTGIAISESGNIVAVGGENNLCPWRVIEFFDRNGQLKWRQRSNGSRLDAATDVIFDQAANIVVTGANRPAYDVVSDLNDSFYILKLDTLGQTLLYQNYYIESNSFSMRSLVIEMKDSVYVVGVDNRLFWLSKDGTLLNEQVIDVSQITGLSLSANNQFTVLSPEKAILYDKAGQELAVFKAGDYPFLEVASTNDTTYLLSKNELIAIYDAGNTSKIALPARLEQGWMSSGVNRSELSILYEFGEGQASILKYHQLSWDTIRLQVPLGEIVTEYASFDNQFYFAGRDQWGQDGNPFQGAYISSTSSGITPSTLILDDLSMVSVDVEPIGTIDTFDRIPDWQNPDSIIAYGISALFRVTFEVSNLGSNEVDQFVLFSESLAAFNCVENRLYEQVENVAIAAGQTFSYSATLRVSASFSPEEVLNGLNMCFSLAAPNHKFDQQKDNNHFCTALLTSAKERFALNNQLKVFPNPANNTININLDAPNPIQQIELFDLQGRLHSVDTSIQGARAQVARGNLPAGVYILRVFNRDGLGIKKIILK